MTYSEKVNDGFELEADCLNTWVVVTGVMRHIRGYPAISDFESTNGHKNTIQVQNIESSSGEYCKWNKE